MWPERIRRKPKRDWVWIAGFVVLAVCGSGCAGDAATEDPFLWLEELHGERALQWVAEQNRRSKSDLESTVMFERLARDAQAVLGERGHLPLAEISGDHAYGFWQDDRNPRGVWRRASVPSYLSGDPEWEIILDLDELAVEENESWTWVGARCLEPENDRCLIGLSRSGIAATAWREFSISDRDWVEGGFVLPEAQSNWAWMDENTLFVATDWGDGKMGDAYSLVAKLWRRGEPMGEAQTVVDASADGGTSVWPETAYRPEGRFAYVGVSRGWLDTSYYAVAGDRSLTLLPCSSACEPRGYIDGRILFEVRNDWRHQGNDYQKGSLVAVDVESLKSELVYAPKAEESVRSVHVGRSAVFIDVLHNIESVALRFERSDEGWSHSVVEQPGGGVIQLAPIRGRRNESSNAESNALLISHEGITAPPTLYYLSDEGELRQIYRLDPSFEIDELTVEQRWTVSKDGVRVPYFVAAKRAVLEAGDAPVMLYGYGGFHIPVLPRYRPIHGKLWIDHGGVYVIANIRGGGEFGARWHEAALKEGRQKSFNDFYAVAKALVADGVTRPERIGIWGASNGGLLTAAALTQRPELFGAVISEVPVIDLLRYTELGGSDWIDELGDPDHPEEMAFLRSISPYHNVRSGTGYPPTLLVSSSMDDVVHAGHARKFVARLQEVGADVLYYEAGEGGHGGTGLATGAAYEWALQYAFLHKTLFQGAGGGAGAKSENPAMQIDHVILAIDDLESGMKEFEELSGVKPIYGGSHPDRDTHNAIAPLSGGIYVEILAPKDGLDAMPDFFKSFHRLTLVGFAIAARDMERVESSVRAQGLDTGGIVDGSRETPDGGKLAWRLLLINDPEAFMNPFFISWSDDSEHPSESQPPRCELESLKLTTPHKKEIERILAESGAEIPKLTLDEGAKQLTLVLKTPKGELRFES